MSEDKKYKLPDDYNTLQEYIMKDVKGKIETLKLEKGSLFNRLWYVKNVRKNIARIYGSIINGNEEVIISLEYILLMKMHLGITINKVNMITREFTSKLTIYKLTEIEFDGKYKEAIEELIRIFNKIGGNNN